MDKNKLLLLFKLSNKFLKRYLNEYFLLLLKPILIGVIGILSVFLAFITPELAIVSLFISIPCVCYAFWRGYLITYSLNIAACNFIKNNASLSLKGCYQVALKDESKFAAYVTFYALVTIIGFLPAIIYTFLNADLTMLIANPTNVFSKALPVVIIFIINSLILIPFLNFGLQAYTFKKDENFVQLFLNCYKKLDLTGFIIAIVISGLCFVISTISTFLYILTFVFINLVVYSINTFWYYSRISIK